MSGKIPEWYHTYPKNSRDRYEVCNKCGCVDWHTSEAKKTICSGCSSEHSEGNYEVMFLKREELFRDPVGPIEVAGFIDVYYHKESMEKKQIKGRK